MRAGAPTAGDGDEEDLGTFLTVKKLIEAAGAGSKQQQPKPSSRPASAGARSHRAADSPLLSRCRGSITSAPLSSASGRGTAPAVVVRPNSAVAMRSAEGGVRGRGRVARPVAGMRQLQRDLADEDAGPLDIAPGDGVPRSRQAVIRHIRGLRGGRALPSTGNATPPPAEILHELRGRFASGSDEYGAVQVETFEGRRATDARMPEPARDTWHFPSEQTTAADVAEAAEKFAQERARFTAWAKAIEKERAANAESGARSAAFDSIWIESALAQCRLAGPSRETDGAGVFRSLGVLYLLNRAVDTLVPATARAVLHALLVELRECCITARPLVSEAAVRNPRAAADDLEPEERPAYADAGPLEDAEAAQRVPPARRVELWAARWSSRRLAGESLHLERLRRARDANACAKDMAERAREYERDVDVVVRSREHEEQARLRMIVRAWDGFTKQKQMKRRVASGVIGALADRANASLCRAVLYAMRTNAAAEREYRRRQRQFDDAAAHKLAEAELRAQVAQGRSALSQAMADSREALDSALEAHVREIRRIEESHEDEARRAREVHAENKRIAAMNDALRAENRRWALLANKVLLEVTAAVERRTGTERRHPEAELLYAATRSEGDAPVAVSQFPALPDVLDGPQPSQQVLLLFCNFAVRTASAALPDALARRPIENFTKDLSDGVALSCAFSLLYPTLFDRSEIAALSAAARVEKLCQGLATIGVHDLVTPTDIMLGSALRNLSVVTLLFRLYAQTVRFGTADADVANLEARELVIPGLRRRRRASESGRSTGAGSSAGRASRKGALSASTAAASDTTLARHAIVKFSDFDTVAWRFPDDPAPDGGRDRRSPPQGSSPTKASPATQSLNASGSSPSRRSPSPQPAGAEGAGAATVLSVAHVNVPRVVNVDIAEMERRVALAIDRQRAWAYLAEMTSRDQLLRLHAARHAQTGEVLDERGRRFMDWFLDVDEDRLWRLVQLNPCNAKNEVDKVHVVLQNNYFQLRAVYQAYAAVDAGQRVSQEGFHQLVKDAALVKGVGRSTLDEAIRFVVEDLNACDALAVSTLEHSTAATAAASRGGGKAGGKGAESTEFAVCFAPTATEKTRRKLQSQMINFQLSPQVFVALLCYLAHLRYRDAADDQPPAQPSPGQAKAGHGAAADGAVNLLPATADDAAVNGDDAGDGGAGADGAAAPSSPVVDPSASPGAPAQLPLHKCVRRLLTEDIIGVANTSTVDVLRASARHPLVQKAHRRLARNTGRAFKTYATVGATNDGPLTTAAAIANARGKLVGTGAKYMSPEDALKFCRDCRLLDARFQPADVQALASALSSDDARLMQVCEDGRARAINAHGLNDSAFVGSETPPVGAVAAARGGKEKDGQPLVPFEIEAGQPEDRKAHGMSSEDFTDFLTGVALIKGAHPLAHTCNTVAAFYRDYLGPNLRELHL